MSFKGLRGLIEYHVVDVQQMKRSIKPPNFRRILESGIIFLSRETYYDTF